MILEYNRPKSIDEALKLLQRSIPTTKPLGGGSSFINLEEDVAVVDLQDLNLNNIIKKDSEIVIGATTKLEQISTFFNGIEEIKTAIQIDAAQNQRNNISIAGYLFGSSGRSTLLTVLLALDASVSWLPGNQSVSLNKWLQLRKKWESKNLITSINIIPEFNVKFDSIGRSALDKPILCCAVAKLRSGKLRIVIGGFGEAPIMAFESTSFEKAIETVEDALLKATDEWATGKYRKTAGTKLIDRLIKSISNITE